MSIKDMESKMVFTAEENGFIIEADGKKLRVSYEEFKGSHRGAMEFCKERGGGDETVENWRFMAKYRDIINKELKALGKGLIVGWYWSNEITWYGEEWAFFVDTGDGDVGNVYRDDNYDARAISVL